MTSANILIAIAALAVIAACLMGGCVRGDLVINYGGHKAATVSNLQERVSGFVGDYKAAEDATPGWWEAAWKLVCKWFGMPEVTGSAAATLSTLLLGKIGWRKWREKKEKAK